MGSLDHMVSQSLRNLDNADKVALIKQLLSVDIISLKNLRRCSSSGIPDGEGLRSRVWQLLLGYLPCKRAAWPDVLKRRRAEYTSFCSDFALRPSEKDTTHADDHPLSNDDDSSWNCYFKDMQFMEQIDIDVERTQQGEAFFAGDGDEALLHRTEMKRALFIHTKLNPGLKYVQGMNELFAPLYHVFKSDAADAEDAAHAEGDAFFCFIQLLDCSENRDLYCKALDKSASGTTATLDQMMANLAAADPSVAQHLRQQKIDPHYFAFRWITVLFCQDLETFPDILRVWDYLLGDEEGCKSAILRLCTALVVNTRSRLLAFGFQDIVKLLQNLSKEKDFDVEAVLSIAASLNPRYNPWSR